MFGDWVRGPQMIVAHTHVGARVNLVAIWKWTSVLALHSEASELSPQNQLASTLHSAKTGMIYGGV